MYNTLDYISPKQAGEIIGVNAETICYWVNSSGMRTMFVDGKKRILKEDIEWLSHKMQKSKTKQFKAEVRESKTKDGYVPLFYASLYLGHKSPKSLLTRIYEGSVKAKKIDGGWYVSADTLKCKIKKTSKHKPQPVFDSSLVLIKSALVTLAKLLFWRDKYNGEQYKPNWESNELKPCIYFDKKKEAKVADTRNVPEMLTFKDKDTRDKFFADFKSEIQTLARLFN